jgi:predicted nucleic acid-binding protein
MSVYYLDTSAAVKLYVVETGSAWLRHQIETDQPPIVLSCALLQVEIWSAFRRRLREGTVTEAEYTKMVNWFAEHCHALYRFVPVDETGIQLAHELIDRHPLRAYDALHRAAASRVRSQLVDHSQSELLFLSADVQLNEAASSEGLQVENPNEH